MEALVRLPKQLGAALRRERRRQRLSQQELAEKVQLRQATISRLEAGEPGTQFDTILRVITALDLELVVRQRTKAAPDDFMRLLD